MRHLWRYRARRQRRVLPLLFRNWKMLSLQREREDVLPLLQRWDGRYPLPSATKVATDRVRNKIATRENRQAFRLLDRGKRSGGSDDLSRLRGESIESSGAHVKRSAENQRHRPDLRSCCEGRFRRR